MSQVGKILVVEDSPPNRMIICHLLRKLGFFVLDAGDGEEALKLLSQPETEVDAVLTDLMMPKMDGLQLLKELRSQEKWAKTPVFIVTALNELYSAKDAEAIGCTGSMIKPISVSELLNHLAPYFPNLKTQKAG